MTQSTIAVRNVGRKLQEHAREFERPELHLKNLIAEDNRLKICSIEGGGILYDFSRQRLNRDTLALLADLAEECDLAAQFREMTQGHQVNRTEHRAALHTAARRFSETPIEVNGEDVMAQIRSVREQIRNFSRAVHAGQVVGSTGKPFRHIVVIGIGGSYLGTEFIARALEAYATEGMQLTFVSNVDVHNFGAVVQRIDPETTLWVVISKSYTTTETIANANLARQYMQSRNLDPARHLVTVTSKGSPGDAPGENGKPGSLGVFHMFDFIGGRYSVTSAVGGVPLSLYLGYDRFEALLKGAEEMDSHATEAPVRRNLPMMAALISVWNRDCLNYPAHAVVPYASPLAKLPPHIQQLSMESNGKSVSRQGRRLDTPGGIIIFGEPGTNAQHSFFQLAHQGPPFPIEFIGVVRPQAPYADYKNRSKGVDNHQELWANLIAQPMALAQGQEDSNPAKRFPGNRPSSTLLLDELSPRNVGRLLAFYEAKTVFEAFIWDINPFDQFGVELGKTLASRIRSMMAARNQGDPGAFAEAHPIDRFYLQTLFGDK